MGTYGYMAPEQFRGQAYLATDLYGLGTSLLFLLTGKFPADLPRRKLKISFRPYVKISVNFANWIDKLIEPDRENRFLSAQTALDVLQGKKSFRVSSFQQKQPSYSSIKLIKTEDKLVITIPPALLRDRYDRKLALLTIAWYTILLLILFVLSVLIPGLPVLYIFLFVAEIIFDQSRLTKIIKLLLLPTICLVSLFLIYFALEIDSTYSYSVALIAFFLVFLIDIFGGEFCKNMLQSLIGTIRLEIKIDNLSKANAIALRRKILFFTIADTQSLRKFINYILLTDLEKTWLMEEIERYF